MKGVILAAGKGTRMLPLTLRRPKPLVPVLDRPMIEHIIGGARDAGVDNICLIIGHLGEMIQEQYGDGSRLGVRLEYVWQTGPAGTGAATLLAEEFVGDEPFFLSWGDIIVPPRNYARLTALYRETNAPAILSVNWVEDPWEGAAVYVRDGLVERIEEKPPRGTATTHFNNAGIFLYEPLIFDVLRQLPLSVRGEIEMPDAVQELMRQGIPIRALETEGYWSDVARPAAVIKLSADIILDQDPGGVIVDGTAAISPEASLVGPVQIGAGCRVGAGAVIGPRVVLGPGVQVGAGALLEDFIAFGPGTVGDRAQARQVVLEEGAGLPAEQALTGDVTAPAVVTRL